jgi:hypothetical protein
VEGGHGDRIWGHGQWVSGRGEVVGFPFCQGGCSATGWCGSLPLRELGEENLLGFAHKEWFRVLHSFLVVFRRGRLSFEAAMRNSDLFFFHGSGLQMVHDKLENEFEGTYPGNVSRFSP